MYLWWSLCTWYLHACQVRVTVGNSGLCCCICVTSFKCYWMPLCVDSDLSVVVRTLIPRSCTLMIFSAFLLADCSVLTTATQTQHTSTSTSNTTHNIIKLAKTQTKNESLPTQNETISSVKLNKWNYTPAPLIISLMTVCAPLCPPCKYEIWRRKKNEYLSTQNESISSIKLNQLNYTRLWWELCCCPRQRGCRWRWRWGRGSCWTGRWSGSSALQVCWSPRRWGAGQSTWSSAPPAHTFISQWSLMDKFVQYAMSSLH